MGEKGEGIKNKKGGGGGGGENNLIDTTVITRGKEGWREVQEGKGGMNGGGKRTGFGC